MFFAFFLIRQLDFRPGGFETSVLCTLSCSFGYASARECAAINAVYDLLRWNPNGQNNLQLAPSTDRWRFDMAEKSSAPPARGLRIHRGIRARPRHLGARAR